MSNINIAVLGAGVIGLTTAFELKNQFHNANITIISEKFNEDTTSHVAAGIFRPGTGFVGPTEDITKKWIDDSYHYWNALLDIGKPAGISEVSGYIFSNENPNQVRNQYIEKLVPIYRAATRKELGSWKYGSFFQTTLTECSEYLPWITSKLKAKGVEIINEKIETFNDLPDKYAVVINSTGLGAKFLCNDNKLLPIRGQVLKVAAPWIKTFCYANTDTYIIPGINCVTLGGCRNYDSYDLTVNKYDSLSIRERCEALVPSLAKAKVITTKVGLRPHRDIVRVEKEIKIINNNRRLKIVHNYGHGGYGVTTAPGTSLYAVQLVREFLTGNSKL